jgi:hypothetical protein
VLALLSAFGIGTGVMLVLYGPQIDDFHRARGDDSVYFRVPARWRGVIGIVASTLTLILSFVLGAARGV